jgi:hypothetical protein
VSALRHDDPRECDHLLALLEAVSRDPSPLIAVARSLAPC